jgi:hypothetical protein
MSGLATHKPGRHQGFGVSVHLAREPKPQQPKAASKPAPVEVMTVKSLPPDAVYRVVLDLEGLQDAFADRVEDLGVSMTEIDSAIGLTRGNVQKLLSKSDAKWARGFGWKSLGKILQGTGLMLVLVEDSDRFAPLREQMVQRKVKRPRP